MLICARHAQHSSLEAFEKFRIKSIYEKQNSNIMNPLRAVLFLILLYLRVVASQECEYQFPDSDSRCCIKAQSKATATFSI